ncbi:MAG: YajG family lipoprotein [Gammaproteobacteria bacterium]
MRNAIAVLALAALSLAGCALSPQTITVTPALSVAADNVGKNRVIGLHVLDERENTAIGSRGGVYAKSSTINPANDVGVAVYDAMKRGLETQGYQLGSANADAVLHVAVKQLSYHVPQGAMATNADITVAIRVTAERGGKQHSTDYRSTVNRKFPVAPTATQNEEWINETLGETLARFFADKEMRAFLNN